MYYTYLWLREDGTPYYVGKGFGRRYKQRHRIGNAPPLGRIVFYIAKDELDAFETEVALIWYYGRKDLGTGCLRNFTNGGEGASGFSKEVIARRVAKFSKARMGHTVTEETRSKMRKGICAHGHKRIPGSGSCAVCRKNRATGAPLGPKPKPFCKRGHLKTKHGNGEACQQCVNEKRNTIGRCTISPGILKPYCTRGHKRSADNVYASGECKICAKQKSAERREKIRRQNV